MIAPAAPISVHDLTSQTGSISPRRISQKYQLLNDEDVEAIEDPSWLVAGILPANSLGIVYGLPGTAKSFLALDWSLRITTGTPWVERQVEQGPVVYIAAEGAQGYKSRLKAWKAKNAWTGLAGLYFVQEPLPLIKEKELSLFLNQLSDARLTPKLIVVDTFARCFSGDDNSAQEVGAAIVALDRLRLETGASVLAVHHSRKDDGSFRGSGALEAAVDLMVHLQRSNDLVTVSCRKMKDAEAFSPISFTFERCAESRVLMPSDSDGMRGHGDFTGKIRATFDALGEMCLTYSDWQNRAEVMGVARGSFDRNRAALVNRGAVVKGEDQRYRRTNRSVESEVQALCAH